MPIDVAFAFRAHLERAKALFAPDYGRKGYPADEAHVEAIFGHEEVEPGIYVASLNGDKALLRVRDGSMHRDPRWRAMVTGGVADDPGQVSRFVAAQDYPCPIAVIVTPVGREHQPETEGWRWSKWGRYIGTCKPQAEYLADEPEIDLVYVWQAVPIDPVRHAAEMEAHADAPGAAGPRR